MNVIGNCPRKLSYEKIVLRKCPNEWKRMEKFVFCPSVFVLMSCPRKVSQQENCPISFVLKNDMNNDITEKTKWKKVKVSYIYYIYILYIFRTF